MPMSADVHTCWEPERGSGVTTASLRTGRLDLALPTAEDAEAIFTIAGDRATVAHNPSDLLAHVTEACELVSQWIQHWQDRGLGYRCVREAGQSQVVGYCGVKAMSAHGQPVLNLIYRFTPDVWGRGYATEAAIAAVAWAGQHQPDATILVRFRPINQASQNVALKAGLRRDPAMDEPGEDGLNFAFTNRMGTIEWVRLELPAHVVLPEPPPLPRGVLLPSMADLGDGDRLRHPGLRAQQGVLS